MPPDIIFVYDPLLDCLFVPSAYTFHLVVMVIPALALSVPIFPLSRWRVTFSFSTRFVGFGCSFMVRVLLVFYLCLISTFLLNGLLLFFLLVEIFDDSSGGFLFIQLFLLFCLFSLFLRLLFPFLASLPFFASFFALVLFEGIEYEFAFL